MFAEHPISDDFMVDLDREDDNTLKHYGILRRSGRYPWGSGGNAYQRSSDFFSYVEDLRQQGLTPAQISEGLQLSSKEKFTTTDLRQTTTLAKMVRTEADRAQAVRLKDKGVSNVEIGKLMGIGESRVRFLLKQAKEYVENIILKTAAMIRGHIPEDGAVDIGAGNEIHLGVTKTKFDTAVHVLKEEGYKVGYVKQEQPGIPGQNTTVKVLMHPKANFHDIATNPNKIKTLASYSEDGGQSYWRMEPPKNIDSKRIEVRWGDEGGENMDGIIQLRRGVPDLSLGESQYAQVRVAVDGTHYLKGVAMYTDDLPDGVDVRFNTGKARKANKLDAMKPQSEMFTEEYNPDPNNPFGANIKRQKHYIDSNGKEQLSPLNIVNEDQDWSKWSRHLSSQFLSKQSPALAKQQLDMTYNLKKEELDEIESLTNPTVKRRLLQSFADDADSSAVYLKAAGLPRTANHVIIPINSLKDTEVYAPKYNNGERVVLIRHPHGGKFEIPELVVNNRNREANRVMKNAANAVGITAKVAQQLSGADFDGDTVLVIPNNPGTKNRISTGKPLQELKNFDPRKSYALPPELKKNPRYLMNEGNKQQQMGQISNLITDMTIKGATNDEIARAVRHSMVVIDAVNHELNWRQSAQDNGIASLKEKYQREETGGGASTIISRAKSPQVIPLRKGRYAKEGGPIDKETGEKRFTDTGESYIKTRVNKKTGEVTQQEIVRTTRIPKMMATNDARTLVSKKREPIELVYADHANQLKGLANQARKSYLNTPPLKKSPSAAKIYAPQVQSLTAKLNTAQKNAPLERQATILANTTIEAIKKSNPDLGNDGLKKVRNQALNTARQQVGAKKKQIHIDDKEWEAIQAGAISNARLDAILRNADLNRIKELATPRKNTVMTSAKMARAKNMLASGYTQAEIAAALGIPASTISTALIREG